MITCLLKYQIDPFQLEKFEHYAKTWIDLVNEMGGSHHGYLLPHEGANNIAFASFSFPSLARYECYRKEMDSSPACQEMLEYANAHRFIVSYDRSFLKPIFDGYKHPVHLQKRKNS